MSTSISPSHDLTFRPELARLNAPFTAFAAGHFVKPAITAQPVAIELKTFQGAYTDLYVAAPLDFDFEEPNAVVENDEVVFITLSRPAQAELPVITGYPVEVDIETQAVRKMIRHAA